ncbi:hypothetical protein H5410_004930 [Solanum commersonii]|uniref:Uncharacterized protein n=1 Tax=Solanum commersonii TaxID=4109 RepID=A0A9J6A5R5_SOLCO|nr:hypothetical protein H5410_004930 [Solanum commersonii]
MEWGSRCVTNQLREVVPSRPMTQNVKGLKAKCFWLARKIGRKTKTTKLIAGCIGLTWIQLERYLEFEAKHGHYLVRRNKEAEKNEEMKA